MVHVICGMTCCWLLLAALLVNAAATKLEMKMARATTTSRKSNSRDLLLVALMLV